MKLKNGKRYRRPLHEDGYTIAEINVPQKWIGKTIGSVNVRSNYNISILAVVKDGKINPMPTVDYVFSTEEHLMVLANSDSIRRMTERRP